MDVLSTVVADAIVQLKQLGDFRSVDENWGQLTFEQPPVGWPCALVDVEEVSYTTPSRGYQRGEGNITVTVADMMLTAMPNQATQVRRTPPLVLLDRVAKRLQGKSTGAYSVLVRSKLKKLPQVDAVRIYELYFRFAFTEQMAPDLTPVKAAAQVTVERQ
jgi:hypothetical protein